jgi:hypothetical protein
MIILASTIFPLTLNYLTENHFIKWSLNQKKTLNQPMFILKFPWNWFYAKSSRVWSLVWFLPFVTKFPSFNIKVCKKIFLRQKQAYKIVHKMLFLS